MGATFAQPMLFGSQLQIRCHTDVYRRVRIASHDVGVKRHAGTVAQFG
jgi:hypothetical protein